jgi:hypothetical protein
MITVTNLRKIFTEQGVKGASSWKREDFNSTVIAAEFAAYAEAETRKPVAKPAKRGVCTECGRKEDFRASGLCKADREYAEWENAHSDQGHNTPDEQDGADTADCPVCHPELDPRKAVVKREGRSRAGMVIIAKGSEVHKSQIFKEAAEAAGWTVTVTGEVYDDDEKATRYYADAYRGTDAIQLAWDGRAYDYPASSALIAGKNRKVRNLKEALRLLAA